MDDCFKNQHPLMNITHFPYTFYDLLQQSAHMGVPIHRAQECVLSNTALCGVSCQSVYEDTSLHDGLVLLQEQNCPGMIQSPDVTDWKFVANNHTCYTVFHKQML
jgi:hypothetical protein